MVRSKKPRVAAPLAGVRNTGDDCFVTAAVRTLDCVDVIRELATRRDNSLRTPCCNILLEVIRALHVPETLVSVESLRAHVAIAHPEYAKGHEDAAAFRAHLLEIISRELNTAGEWDWARTLFSHDHEFSAVCAKCGLAGVTGTHRDCFVALAVPLEGGTVSACLAADAKGRAGEPRFCKRCACNQVHQATTKVTRLPVIAFVHVLRGEAQGGKVAIFKAFSYIDPMQTQMLFDTVKRPGNRRPDGTLYEAAAWGHLSIPANAEEMHGLTAFLAMMRFNYSQVAFEQRLSISMLHDATSNLLSPVHLESAARSPFVVSSSSDGQDDGTWARMRMEFQRRATEAGSFQPASLVGRTRTALYEHCVESSELAAKVVAKEQQEGQDPQRLYVIAATVTLRKSREMMANAQDGLAGGPALSTPSPHTLAEASPRSGSHLARSRPLTCVRVPATCRQARSSRRARPRPAASPSRRTNPCCRASPAATSRCRATRLRALRAPPWRRSSAPGGSRPVA